MNVIKLKMTNSMRLGGYVFPKYTVIYIDKYDPSGNNGGVYTIYNEQGQPITKTNECPAPGGDLLKNSEVIE